MEKTKNNILATLKHIAGITILLFFLVATLGVLVVAVGWLYLMVVISATLLYAFGMWWALDFIESIHNK